MSAPRVDDAERRARLARRHRLGTGAGAASAVEAADAIVGFHATDPASVYLAARARVPGITAAAIDAALYDRRTLIRALGMRRTMFTVSRDVLEVMHSACTRAIAAKERERAVRMVEQAGIATDGARWLRRAEADTLAALTARGGAFAADLAADVPALRARIAFGEGKKWAGTQGLATRVLSLLSADGLIARGRPRGSLTSSQHRWEPMERWLGAAVAERPADEARAELVRRWLWAFGPGTFADLRWWTGWTVGVTRAALADVDVVEVDLDGGTGILLATDTEPTPAAERWVALLPALDATVMGWTDRDWYLGEHRPALFDTNGNAGPTVWVDGRVVGGWAQRKDGEVVFRLLHDIGSDAAAAVAAEARRTADWLGEARVVPRFRTPLERELTA